MAIMSNDDVANFGEPELTKSTDGPGAPAPAVDGVWVLCRKQANGDVENIRAFDDESRARADLELAESVSDDQFWISAVPLMHSGAAEPGGRDGVSPVQALALTWMAQGAEAEGSVPLDDPVVVSPRHVRGFVSVPPHEWREMEENGWVRDGMITPDGADKVGLTRAHRLSDDD